MAKWAVLDDGTALNLSQIVSMTPIEVDECPGIKTYAMHLKMSDGSVYTSRRMSSKVAIDSVIKKIAGGTETYVSI